MGLTDIVEKGKVTIQKEGNRYVIEYSGYNEYGTTTSRFFESRSLRLAYMKLEEYLRFSTNN